MEEIAGYLRQERSTRTLDNRRLLDFQLDEEKNERELKMELDRAEQRTVHYEELTVRIALLEKHLAAVKARGDQAEERGNINEDLLEEQLALQKQRELENIEHSSTEDNLLEEVRQKRDLVNAAEDRFAFAEKKRVELEAIANALKEKLLQAQKQAQLISN
ncbi:Oidioi.mRNA.OKI2018_I69.PAR.g9746.t1.cds [Oikopleura dioica]|uniref:Oidioi.mRNA.OKI2018_I69.PAR.g9746.t1.cds n=1 Tax=Oikopleura dioica TaxID=34765 RepID=A0ABN7RRA5_OIKDI|nr:Oidioi.mRNA.OKI2018_I69.PAR.g9746.t1.cds [Oikopleura dioica]